MNLHVMSEEEYRVWSTRSRENYASDKMKANGLTKSEADKVAIDDFTRLLPDGFATKDHFFYSAKDANQNILGFIWFCVRGTENSKRAYICDIIIEEQYRGKGHGKQLMQLAEAEAKKLGATRIGLHVFGFNSPAIALYKSLGYVTTDLMMEKVL